LHQSQYQDTKKAYKLPTDKQLDELLVYHKKLIASGVKSTLTTYEQFKLVKLMRELQKLFPQFDQIDGYNNLWIVKPSYNARGVGIYCSRDLNEIIPDKEKGQ